MSIASVPFSAPPLLALPLLPFGLLSFGYVSITFCSDYVPLELSFGLPSFPLEAMVSIS
jgi:hypothetical protein